MRIELSPWERTELSLSNRRRRKPGSASKSRGTEDKTTSHGQAVAISFVSGLQPVRPSKKSRKSEFSGEKIVPVVVVTSEERIVTVGKKTSADGGYSVEESQILQYSSRPGSSFLPIDSSLPCISAVLDSKHERFFCVQKDNLRLLSWNKASTPDEAPYHTFDEPVLALSLLDFEISPVAYGTIRNGSLFVAASDDKDMVTKLFDTGLSTKYQHVGTFAQMTSTGEETKSRKHTLTSATGSGSSFFYQIFIDRKDLVVVRRLLSGLDSFEPIEVEVKRTRIALTLSAGDTVESATIVGVMEKDQSVLVGLRIGTDTLVVPVSMVTGNLVKAGFRIPSDARFSSVSSDHVMSASTETDFYLIDASRGATLQRNPLNEIFPVENEGKPSLLVSGANTSNHVLVAMTSEGKVEFAMRSATVSSHVRLADSLSMAQKAASLRPQNLTVGTLSPAYTTANNVQGSTEKALDMLETACTFIRTCDGNKVEKNFLQQAFSEASNFILRNASVNLGNPQESLKHQSTDKLKGPLESSNGNTLNGVLLGRSPNGKSTRKSPNGKATNRIEDSQPNFAEVPSAYLNEAAFMVSNLLVSLPHNSDGVGLQCTQILRWILGSHKLNARVLLRGENGVSGFVGKLCSSIGKCSGESENSYSSTDFVFDLVRCCQDLSESQFVSLLHFLLALEDPKNISSYLVSKKYLNADVQPDAGAIATSRRYLILFGKKKHTKAEKQEIQLLSAKLVVLGVSMLFSEIVGFSEFNGALLRRSIAKEFSREELAFVIRLLPRLVSSVGTTADASKRQLQIVSAMCDSIRVFGSLTEEEQTAIQTLVDIVEKETLFTQALAPFHAALQELSTELALSKTEAPQTPNEKFPSLVSEYQIERLVL